mmetsp:Transcript_138959/g.352249  ORF Transcript_138959/g.352249 Transcript_138959/m.352249 type:complete len:269 (+) Transcript_138959:6992-7798(+)
MGRVPVSALHQQEPHDCLEIFASDIMERGLQRVEVEQGLVRQHVEAREMGVDAARHRHAIGSHMRQQIFVEHVLAVIQHVCQHVDVAQRRREELRDSIVVRISLVEVAVLCKKQQRREGVGVAIEVVALPARLLVIRHRHCPIGRIGERPLHRRIGHPCRVRCGGQRHFQRGILLVETGADVGDIDSCRQWHAQRRAADIVQRELRCTHRQVDALGVSPAGHGDLDDDILAALILDGVRELALILVHRCNFRLRLRRHRTPRPAPAPA